MSESHTMRHGGMGALSRLGYFLVVGAIATSLILTAAKSEAHFQEGKPDPEKPQRKLALNLISIIDPLTDVVRGKWSKSGDVLRCDDQHFVPRVQIRYEPPEEYDFIIQFSQPK